MHFGKIPIPTSIITVGLVLLSDTDTAIQISKNKTNNYWYTVNILVGIGILTKCMFYLLISE